MYKTNSINYQFCSIKDLIWIQNAFSIDMKIKLDYDQYNINVLNDLRALIKDLDDLQRIKISNSRKFCLKWQDLPSQINTKKTNNIQMDPNIRKQFLKHITKQYMNNK